MASHTGLTTPRRPQFWRMVQGSAHRFRRLTSFLIVLALWQILSTWVDDPLSLPDPASVASRLGTLLLDGTLIENARITGVRGLLGLVLGVALGISVALAAARVRLIRAALEPLLILSYPVPRLALYPIAIIILGFGGPSEIALVTIECAFVLFFTTLSAASSIPRDLMWSAINVGVGRIGMLALTARASLPGILAGIRIATPVTLATAVVAELLAATNGLGGLVRQYAVYIQTADMFAVILALGFIGFALDRVTVALTRAAVFWERDVEL